MSRLIRLLHHNRRQAAVLGSLVFATLVCLALLAVRGIYARSTSHFHLVWNLFLAWLPMLTALLAYNLGSRYRRRGWLGNMLVVGICLLFWLLFFPNAPYILTDLLHLRPLDTIPIWYDLLLLIAFAWTGASLGLVSLYLIQSLVRAVVSPLVAWLTTAGVLVLTGFGVWLGRFPRWNSWDLLTNPGGLIKDIWSVLRYPWEHPTAFVFSALFSLCLAAMYLVMVAVVNLRPESDRQDPA